MTESRLHVYNARHHDCTSMGELHGLADAMRRELITEISDLKASNEDLRAENKRLLAEGGRSDSRILELEAERRQP